MVQVGPRAATSAAIDVQNPPPAEPVSAPAEIDVRQPQANIVERAWGAALTLVAMVLILTLIARLVQRRSRLG